ncbi:MAG: restriction endonuclease subunit R [Cyanobacteria bacterium P01_F01_bin.4]
MVQVFQANQLTLHEVKETFGLRQERSPAFFSEWQVKPGELAEPDRFLLDRAQRDFSYLSEYPVQEALVKMVVLSPLLSVAGFYQQPFRPVAEKTIEIEVEADDDMIRGRIDILVLNDKLWVTVIESKGSQFSWNLALPQALIYMMSDTQSAQKRYGLVTNGSDLIFVKLQKDTAQYGLSKVFSIFNPGNDLYEVVGVLKALSL